MKTISVICPSRGRPERLAAMVASAVGLAAHPARVTYEVMVDDDDPRRGEYVVGPQGLECRVTINRDRGLSVPALDDRLALAASGDLIVMASDDVIFRTPGWDLECEAFFAGFPDDLAIGYFDDGRNRDKCEHFVTSRRWVETVGYLMYPAYEHFCADEHAGEIARLADRLRYLRAVVLEHMHFKYGKAPKDETYAAKRREPVHLRDEALFRSLAGERHQAARLVRAAIDVAATVAA